MNTITKPSITIKSKVLTRFQQYHALAITWLPIAGVVGTLIMATIVGVSTSEIVIFAIFSLLTTLGVEVGLRQIDLGGWFIRTLELLGLVFDVKVLSQKMLAAKLQSVQN
jgi:fatty-acid desaturase